MTRAAPFGSVALAASWLVAFTFTAGCGQAPAACGDVCASGSSSCATSCASMQSSCESAGAGADADFQALLTCIANASGSFTSVPQLCKAESATVTAECVQALQVGARTSADAGR